jgi:shikimate kinase
MDPHPAERIVLVGFMGTGKSTIGRSLAERLGWAFRDMDAWIEERVGLSVAEIFRDRGEPFFREEERRVALETRTLRHHVIATGGGAFADPATRAALQDGAATVWLRCDIETILQRVGGDASRPLAAGRERMATLLADRESSYRLAELTVDTADAPPGEVAERIVKALFPGRRLPNGTE